MSFGNYAIIDGAEHKFKKEPKWVWRFKPPSFEDELSMTRFLVGEDRRLVQEVAAREIALTFNGTTIPESVFSGNKEDTDPILAKDASVEDVEEVLSRMPGAMVREIWDKVAVVIPTWGPMTPAEGDDLGAEADPNAPEATS